MTAQMSHDDRVILTRMIIRMLDNWGLNAKQQMNLLGIPDDVPTRMMRRYRDDTPLPDDDNVTERVTHLVGIAEALRTTYPRNINMGNRWMREPHRRFNQRSPIRVIVEDGLSGLINVRCQLDCAYAWERMES